MHVEPQPVPPRIGIRYFDVPSRLGPYIERAVAFDFTHAVGAHWQFLPTGCYGVTLLSGPAEHEFELEKPDDDGAFSGIATQIMGTWCQRPCLAFGISLTPLGVMHLPLHAQDLEATFAVTNEAVFGRANWQRLRALVRDARQPQDKMEAFLRWMEASLFGRYAAYGRDASVAELALLMRAPRPPAITEAAERAGVHRRQLERDFRRLFGTSPKRYATVARVQQVAQLAWQGESLAAIAAELGFTDQAHMSHVVKDVTGMSPSALLRRASDSPLAQATRPFTQGRITHL